jgi:hypothetical protein
MAEKKSITLPLAQTAVCSVILEVQHRLRSLHELARGDQIRIDRVVVENLAAETHRMLDDCLEALGESRAGNFGNAVEQVVNQISRREKDELPSVQV